MTLICVRRSKRPRPWLNEVGGPASSLLKPVVETTAGKVRGYSLNGTDIFKGMPFGAPTGGTRRVLAPIKPQPWPGVRSCLSYGHACPQLSGGIPGRDNQTHGDPATCRRSFLPPSRQWDREGKSVSKTL
ncbi:MAG: carboxylesterase family protein [Limisphaerales bacterium]